MKRIDLAFFGFVLTDLGLTPFFASSQYLGALGIALGIYLYILALVKDD